MLGMQFNNNMFDVLAVSHCFILRITICCRSGCSMFILLASFSLSSE